MATYVKGNAVANATGYELLEKTNGAYTSLAEASEINFEVSALNLASGDHTLVVKAKADGYVDSDYSNEVVYSVEGGNEEPEITYHTITYKYVDSTGATIKADATETVATGTQKTFSTSDAPTIDGHTISSVNPTSTTVNGDITVTYTYTVNQAEGDGEAYWVGEKLSGKTHGTGVASSYLGAQYYYVTDEAAISKLSGKTVDKMAFNFASKSGADTPTGTITVYLVNSSNSVPSNWEAKAEIAVESYPAGSQKEFDITPFTVPTGYTIGYRANKTNILGGGYMMQDYKFGGAYYENIDATSSKDANLGGVDIHIQGM